MTEQELLDEGYGLWYIVLEHTNHRFANMRDEPFIYDNLDVAKTKAIDVSGLVDVDEYQPMMIKDFNLKYKKHMAKEDFDNAEIHQYSAEFEG